MPVRRQEHAQDQGSLMPFIEVNGAALRYELTGGGPGAIVLVHEMGGTLESFDGVAPRLAAKRRVLRYDTRGAGLSEKVRGRLTFDTMTDDLMALTDALGIAGRIAIAGVAVGGGIALNTAARFPERVGAVIAGSPAIGIEAERRPDVLARVDKLAQDGMRSAAQASHDSGYPTVLRGDAIRFEQFRTRWLGNDPESYATIYRMLAASDLTARLSTITCPVLIIGGKHDGTRPPAVVEPVARLIPNARYRLVETGHYMAAQTPELIAAAIGEFLDAVHA
jgi:3-oxoadipate enol-lactonase